MDTTEDSTFPVVLALDLKVQDPQFMTKDAIPTSSVIIFLSTDATYVLVKTEVDHVIKKEQTQARSFIDWSRYSTVPCQIRARSCKHVGSQPTEKVLSTHHEVREALKQISNIQNGDHLAVSVAMKETYRRRMTLLRQRRVEVMSLVSVSVLIIVEFVALNITLENVVLSMVEFASSHMEMNMATMTTMVRIGRTTSEESLDKALTEKLYERGAFSSTNLCSAISTPNFWTRNQFRWIKQWQK